MHFDLNFFRVALGKPIAGHAEAEIMVARGQSEPNPNPNPNPLTSTSQMDSSPTCPDLGFYILSDSCCGRRCLGVSFSGQEPREG